MRFKAYWQAPKSEHVLVGGHLRCQAPAQKNVLPWWLFIFFNCLNICSSRSRFWFSCGNWTWIIHNLAIMWVPRKKCASFNKSSIFCTQSCKITLMEIFLEKYIAHLLIVIVSLMHNEKAGDIRIQKQSYRSQLRKIFLALFSRNPRFFPYGK